MDLDGWFVQLTESWFLGTELYDALISQDLEQFKNVLQKGADPNTILPEYGMSIVHMICTNKCPRHSDQFLDTLLELCHEVDLNQKTMDGSTPLFLAIKNNRLNLAHKLLESGADVKQLEICLDDYCSGGSTSATEIGDGDYTTALDNLDCEKDFDSVSKANTTAHNRFNYVKSQSEAFMRQIDELLGKIQTSNREYEWSDVHKERHPPREHRCDSRNACSYDGDHGSGGKELKFSKAKMKQSSSEGVEGPMKRLESSYETRGETESDTEEEIEYGSEETELIEKDIEYEQYEEPETNSITTPENSTPSTKTIDFMNMIETDEFKCYLSKIIFSYRSNCQVYESCFTDVDPSLTKVGTSCS
ncbi:hypothetical protein M8J76_016398 [Diaphorina citri]|nr:hypothetical protein M8J75_000135 [Diaphorina citri]KAI5730680.1 hypothetical protein M8J76_016398 [Diaphorina citri]